jgi:hypothetical protein
MGERLPGAGDSMTSHNRTNLVSSPVKVSVPEHVVYRPFPQETVTLNLKTGTYYSLNTTAGRMLELLDQLGDTEEVARRLAPEYGVELDELRRDLVALCTDLAERNLVVLG